jgi:DNA-binding NarL/FixJ family response regulator
MRELHPGIRVVILSMHSGEEYVLQALRAGAVGYLLKDASASALFEAIRVTARGESFLQPAIAAKVVAEFARLADQAPSDARQPVEPLSPRELQVLRLIADGATNQAIAEQLCVAPGTVKNHITAILGKLGVSDRTQAALKARELRLI